MMARGPWVPHIPFQFPYTINGTAGNDYITVSYSNHPILGPHVTFQVNGNPTVIGFPDYGQAVQINGLGGNDYMRASGSGVVIDAGDGNDTIVGGGGADAIVAGNGSDIINGGLGADQISGGGGIDTVDYSSRTVPVSVVLEGAAFDGQAGEGDNVANDIEVILGGSSHDYLSVGNALGGYQKLVGNGGNDVILGAYGNDILIGGYGDDVFSGNYGDDYIIGEIGNDTIHGDEGRDLVSGGWDNDLVYGDAGMDTIYGDQNNDQLYGGYDADVLYGGDNDDQMYGDSGPDTMWGNAGDDALVGGFNNDVLHGERGNDLLRGDYGNDLLFGEDDNDRLYGGRGNDTASGGNGNDGLFGGNGDRLPGGLGSSDRLTGGAGADRFLVQLDDVISDLAMVDARINFRDGPQVTVTFGGQNGSYTFGGRNWTDTEIELVDVALNALHRATGNTRLLKRSDGAELGFIRQGMVISTGGTFKAAAWNDSGQISVVNLSIGAMLHEVGHNWDTEFDSTGWNSLSGWTLLNMTGNSSYQQGTGNDGWWHLTSAQFATPYARTNPQEDFAESFMVNILTRSNLPNVNNVVAAKNAFIDNMINTLAT
jgi:Ca2+-binding RTX toxin-like protein